MSDENKYEKLSDQLEREAKERGESVEYIVPKNDEDLVKKVLEKIKGKDQ